MRKLRPGEKCGSRVRVLNKGYCGLFNMFVLCIRHPKSKQNKKRKTEMQRYGSGEARRDGEKKSFICVKGAWSLWFFCLGGGRFHCFTSTRDFLGSDRTFEPRPKSQTNSKPVSMVIFKYMGCFVSWYRMGAGGIQWARRKEKTSWSLVPRLSFWRFHDKISETKQCGVLSGILSIRKTCPSGFLLLTHCYLWALARGCHQPHYWDKHLKWLVSVVAAIRAEIDVALGVWQAWEGTLPLGWT